ncbi:MAG TPA: hypothetical protein VFV57_12625 [Limnobacter sp.]|nr:hypothetical protein [Limnobacter sp.]
MNPQIAPPIAHVSTTEAAQSGLSSNSVRKLNDAQKNKVDRFIKAHMAKAHALVSSQNESPQVAALAKPQVSAEEQAAAVALAGGARQFTRRNSSKFASLYEALFKSDEDFLILDVQDFKKSLLTQHKSLVDLTDWPEPEKALRKYLLAEIALEDKGNPEPMAARASTVRDTVLAEHGEYIRGSIAAVEVGNTMRLSPLRLKDFVRTYQMLNMPASDGRTPDLILLFKNLRKSIEADRGTQDMVDMCNALYAVLKREKSQSPTKATSTRQHLILSRIKQLQTLTVTKSRHSDFIRNCKKAKLYGLPSVADLMANFLQISVGGDILSGINHLVKMATGVGAERPGAADTFLTHYSKFVMQHTALLPLFKNSFQQKQAGDQLIRSMVAMSIIKEGSNFV